MNNLDSNILLVIATATLAGIIALLLVANELGRRAKMALPGRLALIGGLGFGVIAFTIKVGLVFYLGNLTTDEVANIRSWKFHSSVPRPMVFVPKKAHPIVPFPSLKGWRALPKQVRSPANNPSTIDKIKLGKKLFFDVRLSADNSLSCASCHILPQGGDDNAQFSTGIHGQKGSRNAPTVWNAAFLTRFFWDGRASSLEAQAKGPLVNPVEMGMASLAAVEHTVRAIPAYNRVFRQVFGNVQPVSIDNIVKAIAAYERTLITPNTPYDRFVRGDDQALTKQQIRGMALFKATGCRNCHMDPTFSSAGRIKPLGVYRPFPIHTDNHFIKKYDLLVDGKRQKYRVPSLRNVTLTAPYFHNGSVHSLEEAIKVMAVSQLQKVISERSEDDINISWPEGKIRRLTLTRNHALSQSEIRDIAAFLQSLSADLTKRK